MAKQDKENAEGEGDRPFIGILFECCNIYNRIYINKMQTAYVGWCPRCGAKIEIPIDPNGTDERFFRAR
ncbi:MAG: hypothetical protein E3J72_21275 [Planctomycetota bacterium]|nr:MAG: hypothetical protein E3J72_21275 [Planctomycetota bacterium]